MTLAHRNDPYLDEPTVELDPDKVTLWRQAKTNADLWEKEAERLRSELEEQLGPAHAGTVNGVKVVYFRPSQKWAEARLLRDYPDLSQHYLHVVEKTVLDIATFRAVHPEIVDRYQSRSFRSVE